MRITSKISADNAIYSINLGRERMDRLNEMITTQQRINSPSQDPVAAKKILDLETQIKSTDQYISNIKNGTLWLDMVGNTVEGVLSSAMEVKSIAAQAVGGIKDPVKKNEMLTSLQLYRDQLLDIPNTAVVGDQYVFSGYNSNVRPFPITKVTADTTLGSNVINNIDTTNFTPGMPISGPGIPGNSIVTAITTAGPGGAVTISNAAIASATGVSLSFKGLFAGTDDPLNVEISGGLEVNVNVTGGTLLRGTTPGSMDMIKTLDQLMLNITNDNLAGVATSVTELDQVTKEIMNTVSDVGMRKARLENALNAQDRKNNVLKTVRSGLQEVDMAKAATDLTNMKTAFEAALAATAKITPLSLLDYLR